MKTDFLGNCCNLMHVNKSFYNSLSHTGISERITSNKYQFLIERHPRGWWWCSLFFFLFIFFFFHFSFPFPPKVENVAKFTVLSFKIRIRLSSTKTSQGLSQNHKILRLERTSVDHIVQPLF